MAQTFYIEADEEIISIIGRLRHTNEKEIALIVPKHAILMQSIVSLKLLEREATKIGKMVIVVSQDENGRALAEKAGLQTHPYQEEQSRQEEEIKPRNNSVPEDPPVSFSPPKLSHSMKAENVGSESFFNQSQGQAQNSITKMSQKPTTTEKKPSIFRIPIRDKTPKYQTALNSTLHAESERIPFPKIESQPLRTAAAFVPPTPSLIVQKNTHKESLPPKKLFPSWKTSQPKVSVPVQLPVAIHSRVKIAITCAGIAVLLLIGTAAFFLLTPKATITIFPVYTKEQDSIEFRLIHADTQDSSQTQMDSSTLEMPYRLVEDSINVPMSITSTGVGTGGERKARGKVIIYNEYGSEPQSLVSTTRLETADGFVFRLTQGVTIPGVTDIAGKREPGAIEAEVIADQPGDASNIAPATFTIPGFKGSPKYAKFSAKSLTPMTGGSKNSSSGDALLSKDDIDQSRTRAKTQALEIFHQKISETLLDGEKIEESGIELLPLPEEPLLHEGIAGSTVEVVFHYKVKAYIISEHTVERAVLRARGTGDKGTTGLLLIPQTVTVDTLEIIPDFQTGGGKLKVTASLVLMPEINNDALLEELIGKQSDTLKEILNRHPEIVKMNLEVKPNFFIKYIPKNKSQINIVIAPSE